MHTFSYCQAHVMGHNLYENLHVLSYTYGISYLAHLPTTFVRFRANAFLHLYFLAICCYLLQTATSPDQNKNTLAYALH